MIDIAAFEVRTRLRRVSTYIYFAVFLAIAAFFVLAAGGALKGATVEFGTGGKVYVNSPYSICLLVGLISHFGISITAAIAGQATYKDIEHGAWPLFFTAPISKARYLSGRLLGAFAVMLLIYPAIGLGAWISAQLPWLEPSRVGPSIPWAYAQPYLILLLPNLVLTTALFFCMSTLLRRMLPVYVGAVLLVIGYLVAVNLSDGVDNKQLAAILDPFGVIAVDTLTRYWTVADRNTRLIPLAGVLLANRALWMGVALALIGLTYWRFSLTHHAPSPPRAEGIKDAPPAPAPPGPDAQAPGARGPLGLLLALTRLEILETVKSILFLVILLAGVLLVVVNGSEVGKLYGTHTYPVTGQMLEVTVGSFWIFLVALITIYAGEIVWRERDAGMAQIYDALPIRPSVVFASKLFALMAVQVLLLLVVMACSIGIQAAKGYYHFELPLYLKVLFGVRLPEAWALCALAMLAHVLVNHKHLANLLMVVYVISSIALPLLGLEHNLYRFGRGPSWTYSDMNGFGHYVAPIVWFKVYWGCLAAAFALAAGLFWVRGMETGLAVRIRLARARLTRPVAIALSSALIAFAATGAFIYWNTNVRNEHRTKFEQEQIRAEYEAHYRSWHTRPQPRVTDVDVHVDIFPAERRVAIRGRYRIENKTAAPIEEIAVTLPARARVATLSFARGEQKTTDDARLGFRVFRLGTPLGPREQASLEFSIAYENPGFENKSTDTRVVENGTFIDSTWLPSLGYRWTDELSDDNLREKHGLPPRAKMADIDDASELRNNYFIPDADWITFKATVGTSPDQIAIAPGYLQKEWTEPGRRYFHYAMDSRILNFYAFMSARYAVHRDAWKDVAIEIFHHPGHTYNTERMVKAVKAALEYCTANFGPYQHRQVRIIEFPRYELFAQAHPNTIPYSEAIGFILRVDDTKPDEIDTVLYVTAHEVAHQWWAHQVIGGNVQGATVLSETLSQYAALMVMKRELGAASIKKYLRYELDRYLRGRGLEKKEERPLLLVEDQNYIHYAKGSLVMYALQDAIGEAAVNAALRRYRDAVAYQEPPYTTARELLGYLREATPEEHRPLLADLFERITLHELSAADATYARLPDGRYEVRLTTRARKLAADPLGAEQPLPLGDLIDIGVLDEQDRPIWLEKRRIDQPEMQWTIVVDAAPAKAGIDPMNKLVDRLPDDNVVAVEER
jgi:ABC-type transport system involved in multi-copper enzyme maturation permease subunit